MWILYKTAYIDTQLKLFKKILKKKIWQKKCLYLPYDKITKNGSLSCLTLTSVVMGFQEENHILYRYEDSAHDTESVPCETIVNARFATICFILVDMPFQL